MCHSILRNFPFWVRLYFDLHSVLNIIPFWVTFYFEWYSILREGTAYTVRPWIFWAQHNSPQLPEHFIWNETRVISLAPGGADEPQGQVIQGGGQLPGVRGVGPGREAGKPGQAPRCFLPDMLVVAAEGLVDVEQEDSVGAPVDGALGQHTALEQLRGQQPWVIFAL